MKFEKREYIENALTNLPKSEAQNNKNSINTNYKI